MMSPEVRIVDYGLGNLLSVQRGLEYCGAKVTVTSDPAKILSAARVVVPGVGAFSSAMNALRRLGLDSALREVARRGTPVLGICLGMQLLMDESEEFGATEGLGLISGRVVPVPSTTVSGAAQRIPHVGWSALSLSETAPEWKGTLFEDTLPGESAYFGHSLMTVPSDPAHRIAEFLYGGRTVAAAIGSRNVTGCQFHPEKSGPTGLKILRRFLLQ
jgi:imidazole glycerol-phosphate synthase subunit HisH